MRSTLFTLMATIAIAIASSTVHAQGSMPLRDGVGAVVDALTVVSAAREPTGHFSGLLPAEVEVAFQLHVVQEEGDGFSLNIFDIFTASSKDSETTTSVNTITIKLRNIAFAKDDELIADGEALTAAIQAAEGSLLLPAQEEMDESSQ